MVHLGYQSTPGGQPGGIWYTWGISIFSRWTTWGYILYTWGINLLQADNLGVYMVHLGYQSTTGDLGIWYTWGN